MASLMTANRFEEIKRYLHFVHLNDDAGDDRFFKIHPVLDVLRTTFLTAMEPEEFQSIDEQIIPFKGKHTTKQYIPKKHKPWGFKLWVRAGASTGYMYQFELYQGATGGRGQVGELGMAAEVVLRLCDNIKGKNHKVFFDHFFCSISLLEKLKSQGIEATGTCWANRLMGGQAKLKEKATLTEEGRGASSVVTSEGNITVTWWLDSQVIHVASTYAGMYPQDAAKRWTKKEKKVIQILRPHVIKVYNTSMGGVDLLDQCVATYANRRKNLRWYFSIFFHFLDVTCVHAWILYRQKQAMTRIFLNLKHQLLQHYLVLGHSSAPEVGLAMPHHLLSPKKWLSLYQGRSVRPPEITGHCWWTWKMPVVAEMRSARRGPSMSARLAQWHCVQDVSDISTLAELQFKLLRLIKWKFRYFCHTCWICLEGKTRFYHIFPVLISF